MANSVDPDQTAPIRAVSSGSMLFVSILKGDGNPDDHYDLYGRS